jgi:HK97 gp10 family phage protein
MATRSGVELIGLKEANRALRKLPDYAKAKAQEVMNVTAFQVARLAQARAPRRTGQLIGDIAWASRPRSLSAVVGVQAPSYYWKFLEYGTVRMGARPFMRPAADAVDSDHEARLIRALTQAADQVEADAARGLGRLL